MAVKLNIGTSAGRARCPRRAAVWHERVPIRNDGEHGVTRPPVPMLQKCTDAIQRTAIVGADGGGRTHTSSRIPDFESGASANSATSATDNYNASFDTFYFPIAPRGFCLCKPNRIISRVPGNARTTCQPMASGARFRKCRICFNTLSAETILGKLKFREKRFGKVCKRRFGVQTDAKVKIARRLRQETTMTLKWIADRLRMGTWTHVTNRLYHLKK
jgi:hypothetical protein